MQAFIRAIQSERVKISFFRVVGAMILISLIIQIPFIYAYLFHFNPNDTDDKMMNVMMDQIGTMIEGLSTMIFPIYSVAIICTLINIDFKHDGFKLIETQHLGKVNIYLAKVVWTLIITALFLVIAMSITILVMSLLSFKFSSYELLSFSVRWDEVLYLLARLYISSMGFMGIIFILMFAIKKPIIVNIIAFIGIVASVIRFSQGLLQKWIPTNFILINSKNKDYAIFWNDFLSASIIIGLGSLFIGYLFYTHRNHKGLIFRNMKAMILALVTIGITAGASLFVLQPNSQEQYTATIINGRVTGKMKVNYIKITDNYYDVIAQIPVNENGYFHAKLDNISLSSYLIEANSVRLGNIIIKENDSLFLEANVDDPFISVKGTGYADNFLMQNNHRVNYAYSEDYLHKIDYDQAITFLKEEYEDDFAQIKHQHTPDNYTYSKVRLAQLEQLVKIGAVKSYDDYIAVYRVSNNVDSIVEPSYITALRKEIPLDDVSLYFDESYRSYLNNHLFGVNNTYSIYEKFDLIDKQIKEPLRSNMLFDLYFKKISIDNVNQTQLDSLHQAISAKSLTPNIAAKVQRRYEIASLTTSGKILPNYKFINLNGAIESLNDYNGKILVVDFWATWCGACEYQYPSFLEIASAYKDNKDVQFVAISIDENMDSWKADALKKNKLIKQLHITDKAILVDFNITSIPHYLVIGKNGEILNKYMPSPNHPEVFKTMLEKAINAKSDVK